MVLSSDGSEAKDFIFTNEDFEGDTFDAARMVAKYRRVASLDSLRDQLRQFSDAMKKQLFLVINKDYKDFITIATKLDGVDTRVDILRRPLWDLRLEVHSLHDSLLGRIRAVDAKMAARERLRKRKAELQAALSCADVLTCAETGLLKKRHGDGSDAPCRRAAMLAEVTALRGDAGALGASRSLLYTASELERSASALRRARSLLPQTGAGAEAMVHNEKKSGEVDGNDAAVHLRRRMRSLDDALVAQCGSILQTLLEAEGSSGKDTSRARTHVLRALQIAGRLDVAHKAMSTILLPVVKSHLSAGRVGGRGGRGSFIGLSESLHGLVGAVPVSLKEVVGAAMAMHAGTGVDLLVCGIWQPVIAVLTERFPEMFAVAIASTLHTCYRSVKTFTIALATEIIGAGAVPSMQMHSAVRELEARWAVDLYYRMRSSEITSRMDHASFESGYCEVVKGVTPASATQDKVSRSSKQVGVVTSEPVRGKGLRASSCLDMYVNDSVPDTLTATELATLNEQADIRKTFKLPLFVALATEMSICIHDAVCLPVDTVKSKLVNLSLRLLLRLEAFIAGSADVPTGSFPKGSASVAGMKDSKGLLLQSTAAAPASSSVPGTDRTDHRTPAKTVAAPSESSTPASSTVPHTSVAGCPTIEELLLFAADTHSLESWLQRCFSEMCMKVLEADETAISRLLEPRCAALSIMRSAVMSKLRSRLVGECKSVLLGSGATGAGPVRAIASRYRMTNKPVPERCSSYVSTLLGPVRQFGDANGSIMSSLLGGEECTREWAVAAVETVSHTYLLHVQALAETVKSMDSTLQGRRKASVAPGSASKGGDGMSDSEKISLQVKLDVMSYWEEVKSVFLSLGLAAPEAAAAVLPVTTALVAEVSKSDIKHEK